MLKLIVSVQAIDAMPKLRDVQAFMRLTLDKLPGIKADLVRLDGEWQEW